MKIEEIDISLIKPYKNNPREISKEAVNKVKKSIKEFGNNQPIVVDQNNIIVVGHTRYKALKALNKTKVFVIKRDFEKGKAMAYRIMDNRSGEESKWEDKLLVEELEILKDKDFDLDLTGFDKLELDKYLSDKAVLEDSSEINIPNKCEVIIECESEEKQQELYNELSERGLTCRVLNF
jgi:ParB-like chromosome segregation protein Spo0J